MKYGIIAALVFAGLVAACDADANALWLTGAFRF